MSKYNLKMNPGRLDPIASVAGDAVREGPQPSVVVAVATSRETVWTHVAPGEDGASLDRNFLLASISKPITATAVMQQVDQGRLALNVPVARYLPEFGANGKEAVNTWHLLGHSSGLEEAEMFEDLARAGIASDKVVFDACCRSYLNFQPGTAHRYTTITFNTLSELVARLSGEPFAEYLQRHIFEPLGMTGTSFLPADLDNAMPVHDFDVPGGIHGFAALQMAGGGLWSTAADLVRFGQAYLRGGMFEGHRLLSPASIALMTQHYTEGVKQFGTGESFNYGLGWGKPSAPRNGDNLASPRAFGHGGASGTLLWVDPEYDLVFVWLSNRWDMKDPSEAAARALNVAYAAVEVA